MRNWLNGVVFVLKQFCKPLFPTKIYGPRRLPDKGTIIVANHFTALDPIIITIWLRNHIHFMYKEEFNSNAFLRSVMKRLEHIPVKRSEADLNAIKSSIELLEREKIFAIFAEGTRNMNCEELLPFRVGAAMLAIKTRKPVRPIYTWDRHKLFYKNYIIIGEEIKLEKYYTDGNPTHDDLLAATAEIQAAMQELKNKLDSMLAKKGKKRRKLTRKEEKHMIEYNKKRTQREKLRKPSLAKGGDN